jgi:hypothetical protein
MPLTLLRVPTPHDIMRICVESDASQPTVRACLAGLPGRPSVRARVVAALVRLGFLAPGSTGTPPSSAPAPAPSAA